MSSYTVTRVGSNIVLKFGDDVHYTWQISKFNCSIIKENSNYINFGNETFQTTLLYNDCTSPSGATSKYDLIQKICSITDVNYNNIDFANGHIGGKKSSLFFGRNSSVGTTDEDIWFYGGDYNFLTGATTLEIMSSNAEDDYTGLGCRSVLINGLDSNCNELSEVIAITGNGTVTTTNSYIRLQSAYVATCGTSRGSNYNDICIQSTGSNLRVGCIGGGYGTVDTTNYGVGRTQLGIYTVPAGKTLYITSMYVNVDNTKIANIGVYILSNIDNVTPPTSGRVMLAKIDNMSNYREKDLKSYFAIPEKTDIWFRGNVDSETAGIDIQMEYMLVDN
jgi:hypothetical protein